MFDILKIFISNTVFALIVPGILLGMLIIIGAKFLPLHFIAYKMPVQVIGLILVVFFVFQSGRYSEFQKHKEVDLKDKVEISVLKAKSAEINTKTVIEYVDRIKIVEKIKEVKVDVYVTKEADSKCVIDPDTNLYITRLLNSAAIGQLP